MLDFVEGKGHWCGQALPAGLAQGSCWAHGLVFALLLLPRLCLM